MADGPRNPLPVVTLVECLRGIEGEIGDIEVGIRGRADAELGSTTDAGADCAVGPVAGVGWMCSEAALMARHNLEHAIEVTHAVHPGVSLRTIGVVVAASGKFSCQLVPRSPAISQPAGRASDATLSYTALPVPMSAV